MSRLLRASILLLLLAACGGGGNYSAPRNLDNACSIIRERPRYFSAMKSTENKWGVPVYVQMATIHQESKFIGNARTPHEYALGIIPMGRQSSAYGYSHQDEQGRRGAKRDRIQDATDFMGWYMNTTYESLGISKSDARNQYLAYHEGRTGFARGSYNDKPWLLDVADRVGSRAETYRIQLEGCT